MKSRTGNTIFAHWVCKSGCSNKVLTTELKSKPECPFCRTDEGMVRLDDVNVKVRLAHGFGFGEKGYE